MGWFLEQEELSILKRHNVSRSLSFGFTNNEDNQDCNGNISDMDLQCPDDFLDNEAKGTVSMSTKQVCLLCKNNLFSKWS